MAGDASRFSREADWFRNELRHITTRSLPWAGLVLLGLAFYPWNEKDVLGEKARDYRELGLHDFPSILRDNLVAFSLVAVTAVLIALRLNHEAKEGSEGPSWLRWLPARLIAFLTKDSWLRWLPLGIVVVFVLVFGPLVHDFASTKDICQPLIMLSAVHGWVEFGSFFVPFMAVLAWAKVEKEESSDGVRWWVVFPAIAVGLAGILVGVALEVLLTPHLAELLY